MSFKIGFANDIHAVAIAKVVPEGTVRVMACADGIDVVLLHQLDVTNHRARRDNISAFRQELVSVDTFDVNCLPIDKQLSVHNLHFAKTDVDAGELSGLLSSILKTELTLKQQRFEGENLLLTFTPEG